MVGTQQGTRSEYPLRHQRQLRMFLGVCVAACTVPLEGVVRARRWSGLGATACPGEFPGGPTRADATSSGAPVGAARAGGQSHASVPLVHADARGASNYLHQATSGAVRVRRPRSFGLKLSCPDLGGYQSVGGAHPFPHDARVLDEHFRHFDEGVGRVGYLLVAVALQEARTEASSNQQGDCINLPVTCEEGIGGGLPVANLDAKKESESCLNW